MRKLALNMAKIYSSIQGTSDFSSAQACLFNKIITQAKTILNRYNYQEIILPLLEDEGLFRRGLGDVTDIVERQIFKIEGKDMVLRPEGTAQVVRYFIENSLHNQGDFYKFFYVGPMFRGERPQKGRFRQFHHIGVEVFGSNSFLIDAEVILVALSILNAIGITKYELNLNTLGCAADKEKFSKTLQESLLQQKHKFCLDCQKRLLKNPLRVLDCKQDTCKKEVANLNLDQGHLCPECKNDFSGLRKIFDDLKVPYSYNPLLVRGLDYYTNTVFEFTSTDLGSQDAIGAGGRYNKLVESLGGPVIPAVGFALGIERVMLLLPETDNRWQSLDVFIASTSALLNQEAFKISKILREQNFTCDIDYCQRSLKSQLRFALKNNAKFVAILGDDEWKDGSVMLKDMQKSTQEKIKIEDLASKIKLGIN